jgi:myo-inositol-1(or 4)-monophosphatase
MPDPNPNSHAGFLTAALDAAALAAEYLREQLGRVTAREKQVRDLVTEADLGSQALVEKTLLGCFPDHRFLGEESASQIDWRDGFCWVVDPLDGTMNFVHELPSFSVSIALLHHGEPLVGVVHDPWLREVFHVMRGGTPMLNAKPARPSSCTQLGRALLVSSFPATVTADSPELKRFCRVVQRASMRRLGSAALNLCYVGCGRLDGYWASTLSLWDLAAGMLFAREAGAIATHLDGGPVDLARPEFLVAATAELHAELLPLLQLES